MPRALPLARHPATRTPWGWALAGALAGVALALVFFAPAQWLASAVARATTGQVQLVTARGTLWNGSARFMFTGGEGSRDRAALPGLVHWQLRPGWLAFNLRVTADCCTPAALRVGIRPSWSGARVEVQDHDSQWPAEVLTGLGTPWNTVQAEGSLHLQTRALVLTWNDGVMSMAGRAELTALAISSRLSTLKPMGNYKLTVNGGDAATVDLQTLEGSLQLSGTGRWVGSRLRFQGVASAQPEHEAALANLLNIIGRRNGARSVITLG